jgi:hypothetical protein
VVNKVAVIRLFVFGFGWHPLGGGSDSAIRQDPILVCHVSLGLTFSKRKSYLFYPEFVQGIKE